MAEYDVLNYGDYSGQNNFVLTADTVTPELPAPVTGDFAPWADATYGTGVAPIIQDTPRSNGSADLSGVLTGVTAGANSLLNIWTKFNTIGSSIATTKLAIEQQKNQLDINAAKNAATVAIEKAKAGIQIANAQAIAQAQLNPKAALSVPVLIGLAALAYKIFGAKK
jgi:hypothetical protein